MDEHQDVPEHSCPKCGYKSDCVSIAFENETPIPRPGDLSLCLCCGAMNVFTKDLQLRLPNAKEQEWILNSPKITLAQLARANLVGDKIKQQREKEGNTSPGSV